MIIMIDNYDSFTYNIVQYLSELGSEPEVIRNDAITVDDLIAMKPKGIVLSPGPGRPEDAGIINELIIEVNGEIPILGICLGHQAIGQSYGGKIGYAPKIMHGKTSEINHDNSIMFKNIPSPFIATRYHSLVITPESMPDQFIVTAKTEDNVIMGIQHKTMPLYGLQFHPESILTPDGKCMLGNYLDSL